MSKSSEFANVYQVCYKFFAPFNGRVKFTKKKKNAVAPTSHNGSIVNNNKKSLLTKGQGGDYSRLVYVCYLCTMLGKVRRKPFWSKGVTTLITVNN